jgi:transcriptional regulator with XRE-family HTH domain
VEVGPNCLPFGGGVETAQCRLGLTCWATKIDGGLGTHTTEGIDEYIDRLASEFLCERTEPRGDGSGGDWEVGGCIKSKVLRGAGGGGYSTCRPRTEPDLPDRTSGGSVASRLGYSVHNQRSQAPTQSGLSIRTVQRVESGEPSSADTRRALALAFELEDTDFFNRPFSMPDPEQLQMEIEKFKRESVTLGARIINSGQELVRFFEAADMDYSSSAVDLQGEAARRESRRGTLP